MLYRVYVDEAGDRGVSEASDRHFVVSAVIVADDHDAQVRARLEGLRLALRRHPSHVLHFVKFSHSQRLKAVQDIASFPIAAIVNVIVHKGPIDRPLPAGRTAHISHPDPMYLWALRLLLERVSWFATDEGDGQAIITFAHLKGFKTQKLHEYRQVLERSDGTQIRWGAFADHPFRVDSPKSVELLQVADTTASALFRAVEPDDYGNTERRYLTELAPKLYRAPGRGKVTAYGLKVFPVRACRPGGPLEFLSEI